jgi:hypothetical protein
MLPAWCRGALRGGVKAGLASLQRVCTQGAAALRPMTHCMHAATVPEVLAGALRVHAPGQLCPDAPAPNPPPCPACVLYEVASVPKCTAIHPSTQMIHIVLHACCSNVPCFCHCFHVHEMATLDAQMRAPRLNCAAWMPLFVRHYGTLKRGNRTSHKHTERRS